MNFFPVCKNILLSFLVTTSVYFGFVPFILFKSPPIETSIEVSSEIPTVHFEMADTPVLEEDIQNNLLAENIDTTPAEASGSSGEATPSPLPSEGRKAPTPQMTKASPSKMTSKVLRNKSRGKKKRNCTVPNPNIQKINARSYILPKKLIRHYSRNWNEASALAYLGWSKDRTGSVQGIKIRHISCDSPLPYAGLKKGDVVLAVNGKSITSNAKLMKLYPRLFRWRTIELTVLRNGRPLKIQYQVVA